MWASVALINAVHFVTMCLALLDMFETKSQTCGFVKTTVTKTEPNLADIHNLLVWIQAFNRSSEHRVSEWIPELHVDMYKSPILRLNCRILFVGLRPGIHSWLKFQAEDEGDGKVWAVLHLHQTPTLMRLASKRVPSAKTAPPEGC